MRPAAAPPSLIGTPTRSRARPGAAWRRDEPWSDAPDDIARSLAARPRGRSASRGHDPVDCGLACLEEQIRRLRAGDAILAVDHHGRRGPGAGHAHPGGVGPAVGGTRI